MEKMGEDKWAGDRLYLTEANIKSVHIMCVISVYTHNLCTVIASKDKIE